MKLSLIGLGIGFALAAAACGVATDEETGSEEGAFSQEQVTNDPVLKALQERAADVEQYEINVDDIAVPVANASTGASVNGFSTRGLDWFKNPAVSYPSNKSWDQGTDTGKKCQWASIFRFNAIFSDAPEEATAMRELVLPDGRRGMWSGSFWSWTDDYASTDSVGEPTASYAWSSGLWKWIGASGKGGICRIPTRTMVVGMMKACRAQAESNNGDPKNCRMPRYTPPPADAGAGDAGDAGSPDASPDAGDAGANDAGDAG
jgi:hypothetical protein